MGDMTRLVERPSLKATYLQLFNESLLVQQRSTFRLPGSDGTHWRHGWFYDPCADQEPRISGQSKKAVESTSPQPDAPVSKMFFEAAIAVSTKQDILIAPNARSHGASKTLTSHMAKALHPDSLMLVYKEYPAKGKQKLTETVHAASMMAFGLQPARARIHYPLTTTTSDAVVQVLEMEEPFKVEAQEKAAILGADQMTSAEKMLAPTERLVLMHWEKRQEVYEEIFHHWQLTSLVTASVGRQQLLRACIKMGIKVLALCRNAAHLRVVKRDLLEWMYDESWSNPECNYYLPRRDLIEQLGLEPDSADSQLGGLGEASSEGEGEKEGEGDEEEDAQEEPEDEEEPEGEEDEPEEEEEDDEGEDEEDGEPPKKKPKVKAKGKAKGKAQGKAKAKGQAKGKSKTKAKAKTAAAGAHES